jgi:hypothetical protein
MGVGGQLHALAALPPGKETRYPLYRRLRKISPPPGFDPWTIQPVASRYTNYTIPAQRGSHSVIHHQRHEIAHGILKVMPEEALNGMKVRY